MPICKYCGEQCPEHIKETVREVKVEVEIGENAFWLRLWSRLLLGSVLLGLIIGGSCSYDSYLENAKMKAIISDPSVKIEFLDSQGSKLIRKITR